MKKRVCFFISTYHVGGFETKLDCIIRNLDLSRFDVTFLWVYPYYKSDERFRALHEKHRAFFSWPGVETVEVPMWRAFDFTIVLTVSKILRKRKIDILYYAALGSGTFIAPLAGRLAGASRILRANDTILKGLYPSPLRWADWLLSWMVHRIVVPSRFLKTKLAQDLNVQKKKIDVIPNGIDVKAFQRQKPAGDLKKSLGIPSHHRVVGMIANLVPIKQHALLIRAAAQVLYAFSDVSFVLVGEGPDKPALKALTNDLQIKKSVLFLGYRTDIRDLISLMDIGTLCSKVEVHPISLIELMAAGVPVVAPRVGGIPEIVTHDKNGLLFQPGDVDEYAQHLLRLLQEDELRQTFGRTAQLTAESEFSHETMIHRLEAFLSGDEIS